MVEKLILCIQCNKVVPQYDSFGDFGETSFLPGVEWSSEDLNEQKEFLKCHQGHPLEELTLDPETLVSDRPSYEPVKVAYVEANNGKERFLIRRIKPSFDRPASYEMVPGRIQVTEIDAEIKEEDLRKQISWLNGSFVLSPDKVKKFIEAFREEVKSIPPENLHEEIETILPGETSLLAYGSFPEARWEKVLRRCERDFQRSELEMIEKFIHENRNPSDVLGIQIKKKISILEPRRSLAF
jgi:hypothetical protein